MRQKRTTTKPKRSPSKRAKPRSSVRAVKKLRINDARLERALRVLTETKDIKTAARSIRVSVDRFQETAKRRGAIRKQRGVWTVVRRLPRRMPIFTNGRLLAITVNSSNATRIARYMSAVGQFLQTNNLKDLAEFSGRNVKDVRGKVFPFETNPNALYRLSLAGGEPFEELYRIVL